MRESTSPLYDMRPLKWEGHSGIYSSNAWYTDQILFTQTMNGAVAVERSKAQAEAGAHLIFVHRYFRGKVRGQFDDVNLDRDPGHIYVIDQAQRVECIQFPTIIQGMFIPKSMIGFDPDRHPTLSRFANHGPMGRVLFSEFSSVFTQLNHYQWVEQTTIDRFLACLMMAMRSDGGDEDIRRRAREALKDHIRAHIEQELLSGKVSVDYLLARFGVSRATLYRMFDSANGVRQYVSDRRLYRAVLEISEKPLRRGDLTSIAERWGFSSNVNFNRAVKRHFGVPPGALTASKKPSAHQSPKHPSNRSRPIADDPASLEQRDAQMFPLKTFAANAH